MFWPFQFPPAGPRVVRLLRGDIARCEADAIAVSANPYLEGTVRSNYWRFSGRRNADGAVRLAGGRSLADATAKVSARHPNLGPSSYRCANPAFVLARSCARASVSSRPSRPSSAVQAARWVRGGLCTAWRRTRSLVLPTSTKLIFSTPPATIEASAGGSRRPTWRRSRPPRKRERAAWPCPPLAAASEALRVIRRRPRPFARRRRGCRVIRPRNYAGLTSSSSRMTFGTSGHSMHTRSSDRPTRGLREPVKAARTRIYTRGVTMLQIFDVHTSPSLSWCWSVNPGSDSLSTL